MSTPELRTPTPEAVARAVARLLVPMDIETDEVVALTVILVRVYQELWGLPTIESAFDKPQSLPDEECLLLLAPVIVLKDQLA